MMTELVWLGRIRFADATRIQEERRAAILAGTAPEALFLCEHDPVITLGRSARPENVLLPPAALAARGIEVSPASRGGDVTYHGPGQLVAYPVFRLRGGVVAHVETMARAVISALERFGIEARWDRQRPGVWVGADKICAFGIHVQRRVAIHGLALNVDTPLEAFGAIVPCGLTDAGVTSIAHIRGAAPALSEVAGAVADGFARSFAIDLRPADGARFPLPPPPTVPIQ